MCVCVELAHHIHTYTHTHTHTHTHTQLLAHYESLLDSLKQQGGLVTAIVPAYLLPRAAFLLLYFPDDDSERDVAAAAGTSAPNSSSEPYSLRRFYMEHFRVLHEAAWAGLVAEVVRMFALNRVTPRYFEAAVKAAMQAPASPLHGAPAAAISASGNISARSHKSTASAAAGEARDGEEGVGRAGAAGGNPAGASGLVINGSNCLSMAEGLLLRWLSAHYNAVRVDEAPAVLRSWSEDLRDGAVFAAVVVSHVPAKKKALEPVKVVLEQDEEAAGKQRVRNAKLLTAVLRDLQVPFVPAADMIAAGHARVLTLLSLTLMDVLPQLVPKTAVAFAGRLNVPVERKIELSNPTKRQITYMVRLDGSDEFAAADKYVVLDAKASGAITITHTARFSQPAASTLYILPATAGERASPLVFALSSTVQANQPAATVLNLSGQLYEVSSIDVPVSLPFDVDACVLSVSLSERAPAERLGSRGGGWQPPNRGGGAAGGGVTSWKGLPAKAFWVKKDRIKVSKKSPGVVTVYFLPTRLAEHICSVNLKDPAHGEMAVDIAASVELPAPSEVLKFSTADKKLVTKELLLAPKNSVLDRARAHILEMLGKEEGLRFYREVSESPPQVYKVQYLNRDVKGPGEVTLGPQNAGGKALGKAGDAGAAAGQEAQTKAGGKQAPNRLNVQWDCQGPGQYTAEIVLRSKLDVRVVTVLCSVQPKPVNVDLDLVCPLRQSISQELPVSNRSDKEWAVQARISVEAAEAYGAAAEKLANAFTGSGDFKVPAGQTCSYTLTFRPAALGPVTGKLVLTNVTTNETYSYALNGVGEEPVAEDPLVVDCAARKPLVFPLKVGDFAGAGDGDTTYAVQTDLRCISGPPEFVIPRRGLVDYPLQVLSPVGGTFTGAVTFTKLAGTDKGRSGAASGAPEASSLQPDGNYYWYTVEVRASMPSPERLLAVAAQVRTAVAVAIDVGNPMEQAVTFAVELDGDGLLGDDALSVAAGQTATYEAVYSPLVPTSGTQGAISFVHPELGLFWYQVSVRASCRVRVYQSATVVWGAHAPSTLNPKPLTPEPP